MSRRVKLKISARMTPQFLRVRQPLFQDCRKARALLAERLRPVPESPEFHHRVYWPTRDLHVAGVPPPRRHSGQRSSALSSWEPAAYRNYRRSAHQAIRAPHMIDTQTFVNDFLYVV